MVRCNEFPECLNEKSRLGLSLHYCSISPSKALLSSYIDCRTSSVVSCCCKNPSVEPLIRRTSSLQNLSSTEALLHGTTPLWNLSSVEPVICRTTHLESVSSVESLISRTDLPQNHSCMEPLFYRTILENI